MHISQVYALVASVVIVNVAANILIKKGARHKKSIFINRYTPFGYALFALAVLIMLKLITVMEIKNVSLIMAVNCFMTYMAGITVFRERTNFWGIAGIVIMCSGIVVFNL
jgi:multidrug transporter EmrE-like cation transporter